MRGGIAAIVIYIYSRNDKITITKDKIIAACFYTLVVTLFVMANKLTTAGNAILLQYTAPVYVALFGYMFLGERSTFVDWATIMNQWFYAHSYNQIAHQQESKTQQ